MFVHSEDKLAEIRTKFHVIQAKLIMSAWCFTVHCNYTIYRFCTLCSIKNAKYLRIWRNITDSLSVVHEYLIFWFRAAELIHENKLWSWKYLFTLIIMVSQLVRHDTASNKTKLYNWLAWDLCSLKVFTIFRNNFVSFPCLYSHMGYGWLG